jgi:hypothetical protein
MGFAKDFAMCLSFVTAATRAVRRLAAASTLQQLVSGEADCREAPCRLKRLLLKMAVSSSSAFLFSSQSSAPMAHSGVLRVDYVNAAVACAN